ncbi:unnamed protein product [Didymodactylos carnosus]|uniref:Sperm microtubule inner protein 1 C-terminal domain-containing protein n=1 Tax=Didymodactylos carnosus TaxID=1234261 RepID=A0A813SM14_9BILA|nr:unnamed protein product [Didymodactylos carnosus]CAF1394466.1 unnamed protein product [Didymodactylos carnosus]CAF3587718.1 unnamed protein product [Didymodactylos carnosus]CAF4201829.1 unnamed protein product [Didymodactylos carnosus]
MTRMAFDTRTQNAWKEQIEKEAMTRVQWHQTFKPDENDDEWFKRAFYTQKKPIHNTLPTIILPPPPKKRYNPNDTMDELAKKLDVEHNPDILKEMHPVSKDLKQVLFDGFSKEEKGRYKYLNIRKQEQPEQKFQYPITSTMEYGWKLNDSGQKFRAPMHARGKIVEESFYRRNGVFEFKS